MTLLALISPEQIFLRAAAWLLAGIGALAFLVMVIRLYSLLIDFGREPRTGKLQAVIHAVAFPLGVMVVAGALASGALTVEAQKFGSGLLALVMIR